MTHLLKETENALKDAGKTPEDIVFIGSEDGKLGCTWAEYQVLADFEYHSGYGGQEVPSDLQVLFSDGSSLIREDYDGSEWWSYFPARKPPQTYLTLTSIYEEGNAWYTLAEIQENREKE